ncbi:MAG TPA: HAMP domain-containing sensor histidine kinase [Longimicrobium sp.]|nr:HAMP domain-containing sensor histidine kinase [Longimicrobium sp.]
MTPLRRSSGLAPGSAFLVLLLLLMLGLSSVLAYQALDAARSETRLADRTLREYAGMARWELSRRADQALAEKLVGAVSAGAAQAADSAGAGASLAALRTAVHRELAWCACPRQVRGVFRIEAGGGAWSVSSLGMPAELRSAVAEIAGALRASAHDTVRIGAAEVDGARQAIVYHVHAEGGRLRAHGFAMEARAAAAPVLREVVRGEPMLPAIRGGFTNENALAVAVADGRGRVLFRSPALAAAPAGRDGAWMDAKVGPISPQAVPPGAVVEEMGGMLSGLTARVSVRPAVAAGRVSGGAPESRLPLLLAVFGLTLALFGTAVVQLRRQQELVRLRDDFVSGVSHELRTPLAQIRLFADLLETGRLHDPAQRARSVRIINEESRRLTFLVENILHFSRAQHDANRLSPRPVDMSGLVHEIVDAFAPLARDTEFVTRTEPGVVARADRDAFRQVLLNLLDNASKYGPRGQTVEVGLEIAGFVMRVWVADQGPGVPAEDRARIWQPYRRLERDAEGATGGSGIGLAVVRDVVELHGGRAWVEDASGGGARFVVELPGATYAGPPGDPGEPGFAAEPARAEAR